MQIFVTGATGTVGRRFVLDRLERGDRILVLSRQAAAASETFAADANPNVRVIEGNPATPGDWQQAVDGCDAVVHLAGAGVMDRRWTADYKHHLASSRIDSTYQVVCAIEAAERRPRVMLSASAVGYYGDTGSLIIDETSPPGDDFLARLCVEWEQQASIAQTHGVRTVIARLGVVLDRRGGALPKMARPFRMFVGGPIGRGRQYVSWVHWRDLVGMFDLTLRNSRISGPMNVTSPVPVTNRVFSRALGRAIDRPSWLPVPKLALRIVLGEAAGVLVGGQRVSPTVAEQAGYRFLYPEIGPAMKAVFGESSKTTSAAAAELSAATPAPAGSTADNEAHLPAPAAASGSGAADVDARPAAPIRLLAIDVDGTMLRSDLRVAKGVVDACRAAERAGCVVVPSTARSPRTMYTLLNTLGITSPTINFNGAVIWNPLDDEAQFHASMEPGTARELFDAARSLMPEVLVGLDVLDRWFTDRTDALFEPNGQWQEPEFVGPLDDCLTRPITRLSLLGAPERLAPMVERLREQFWTANRVSMFRAEPHLVQFTAPRVDKSIALQRIAKRLGVDRSQVMAIGDAPNDMGMLEWAGFAVAVENAWPAVKQLADVVVPSNDDSGVARAIQRYVLA